MSMVLTRSPLEPIGMNGAGLPKRRSARLSGESVEENEPPAKKNKLDGAQTSTVSTKEVDGESAAVSRKKRKGMTPLSRTREIAMGRVPCERFLTHHTRR
jgi:kinetochore protein Mis13/DSN1